MKHFLYILLFITSTLSSQNVDSLFDEANELYKNEQF